MKDTLKDFIKENQAGFHELPPDELWLKIDKSLKQEQHPLPSKNTSAMIKYSFGAALLLAGTLFCLHLQKGTPPGPAKSSPEISIQAPPPESSVILDTIPPPVPPRPEKPEKKRLPVIQEVSPGRDSLDQQRALTADTLPQRLVLPSPGQADTLRGAYIAGQRSPTAQERSFGQCFGKANQKSIDKKMDALLSQVSLDLNCPKTQLRYSVPEYYTGFYSKTCRHLPRKIRFEACGKEKTYIHEGLSGAITYWLLGIWSPEEHGGQKTPGH